MKWIHFLHRDMTVLFDYFAQRAGVDYLEDMLNLQGFQLKGRKIDHSEIYHDANEIAEFKRRVEARGQDYLDFLVNACEQQCHRIVRVTKESMHLPVTEALENFFTEEYRLMAFLPLFPSVIEPIITKQLDHILEKYATEDLQPQKLKEILTKPSKPYVITLEEAERYVLGAKIQGEPELCAALEQGDMKTLASVLQPYIDKFGWMETRHFKGNIWTLEDVADRLKAIMHEDCSARHQEISKRQSVIETEISHTYEMVGMSIQDIRKVKTIRDFIYLRTQRKDSMSEANYYMLGVFKKIADSAGIAVSDLVYLMPNEIKDLEVNPNKGKNYKEKIGNRRKGFILITYDGATRIFTDSFKSLGYQKANGKSRVIGMCTFEGEVGGLARRVMDKDKIETTRQGEIMVTPMTSPDYIVIMDKLAGIITDEGGITCHAAHLSREYKIPCIIGTGNATKIFSTGDMIHLNAKKGYAKRITK